MKYTILLLLCVLSFSISARSTLLIDGIVKEAVPDNLALGRGVNLIYLNLADGLRSKCIDFESTNSIGGLSGSTISGVFETFDSQKKLMEKLSTAFGASGSISSVGVNVAYKLLKQIDYNYKYSYAYIWLKKTYLPKTIRPPSLSTTVKAFTSSHKNFVEHCGTRFVSSYVPGAFATGIIECSTKTTKQQQLATSELKNIEGKINISGHNLSLSGNLESAIDRIEERTQSHCKLLIDVGGGSGSVSTNKKDFISSLATYVFNSDPKNATILRVNFDNYANYATDQETSKFLRDTMKRLESPELDADNYKKRINQRIEDIEQINLYLAINDQDSLLKKEKLFLQRTRLRSGIDGLLNMLEACAENPFGVWNGRCGQK